MEFKPEFQPDLAGSCVRRGVVRGPSALLSTPRYRRDDTVIVAIPAGVRTKISNGLLLFVRGALLWLVVPLAAVAWILLWPLMRRRNVSIGSLIGWADLNLIAALQRSLCRLDGKEPVPWPPWAELPRVSHRVQFIDSV